MSYHYEYLYIALTFMCNIDYDYEDVVEYQSSPPYTLYHT